MIYIKPEHSQRLVTEFPDLFASKSERKKKDYIQKLNDYFTAEARSQFSQNLRTFARNYKFLKGELTPEDFYEVSQYDEVHQTFVDLDFDIERDGLPSDIQHYSILNQPINTLLGELSGKPDNFFVKGFDEDSQSERLQFLTEVVEQYMYTQVKEKFLRYFAQQGVDMDSEEFMQNLEEVTAKEVSERMSSHATLYERWGNRMLEALKVELDLKEKSEAVFADLLKVGRERYHIYEDNSPRGFNVEDVNPVNTFRINNPDKKYTRDDYVSGIIEVLDISELMSKFRLTKEDIDNLRDVTREKYTRPSTGVNSISYQPTYDRTKELFDELEAYDEIGKNYRDYSKVLYGSRGWDNDRYLCVTTYVKHKVKRGKLTYINSEGIETVDFVDEDYKDGLHPGQISLEWTYVDQWYKGVNIAHTLYSYEPVEFIDRNPLIGADFDPRNSLVKGLVDLAKPFQVIYTVAVNQLFRLLQKEIGVIYNISLRKLSVPKDGDYRDALDMWEDLARDKGIAIEDDSPENMNAPGGQTASAKAVDLSRTNEIQSRYTLAQQMKMECWELLGITRERLGSVTASQTAFGAQTSLSQSYAQTAPWFSHHYYVLNQLYQAILDAAQYFESQKEESTLSFISGTAEHIMIRVLGRDLLGKDLRVFVTDRAEDYAQLQTIKGFTQEMIQNGVDPYDIVQLLDSKSIRAHKDVLRKVKEHREELERQQMQIEAQKAEAIDRQTQALQEMERARLENENFNKERDRETKIQVAAIHSLGRQKDDDYVDANQNQVPDMIDVMRTSQQESQFAQANQLKLQTQMSSERLNAQKLAVKQREINLREKEHNDKMKQLEKDRELKEKQLQAQKYIAKINKN